MQPCVSFGPSHALPGAHKACSQLPIDCRWIGKFEHVCDYPKSVTPSDYELKDRCLHYFALLQADLAVDQGQASRKAKQTGSTQGTGGVRDKGSARTVLLAFQKKKASNFPIIAKNRNFPFNSTMTKEFYFAYYRRFSSYLPLFLHMKRGEIQ